MKNIVYFRLFHNLFYLSKISMFICFFLQVRLLVKLNSIAYCLAKPSWHEIQLQDGRRFALNFKADANFECFVTYLRRIVVQLGISTPELNGNMSATIGHEENQCKTDLTTLISHLTHWAHDVVTTLNQLRNSVERLEMTSLSAGYTTLY